MSHQLIRRACLITCTLLLLPLFLLATHNRAGEIVVEQVGECGNSLTVRAVIITYTETIQTDVDRDSLDICWDDGTCSKVARSAEILLEDGIKRNEYEAFHTYSGYGTYFISMTDPNRVAGILNVNFPNSVQIRFHIFTIFTLANPATGGCNRSPRLETPPLDRACAGEVWTHNPGAYDPDGDSLVFEFTVPLQDVRTPVPNFRYPDQVSPGPANTLTIDRQTGQITWNAPVQTGEYNLAFLIISFRNGFAIDTMIRDMQIFVDDCENDPPTVEPEVEEICVIAGEVVEFNVTATAPLTDENQLVQLTATGGPLVVPTSPATFTPVGDQFLPDPLVKSFRWQTTCEHISDQPYFVVFRAQDNFFGDTSGLATLKAVSIKVVGPPPQDVQAEPSGEEVTISWELPYECEEAENDYFLGFTVWRRLNSNAFEPDTCRPGLDGRGYQKLTLAPIRDVQDGRYLYRDQNVERGKTYCYRVLAVFGRRTAVGGFIYQQIESLPSDEVCVQLSRDVPLLTNVDVETTDAANGQIRVCWVKPISGDLDTTINRGPYRYEILRAEGQTTDSSAFAPIGVEYTTQNFSDPVDSCFVDAGLNTVDNAYSYRINFYVNNEDEPLGASSPASSVYLSIDPTDNANQLSWTEETPWDNFSYTIFRREPGGSTFDSIAAVTEQAFRDTGLINGFEYCYYVRSSGTYGITAIRSPLLNRSQRVCGVPADDVAPCPPVLDVQNVCDGGGGVDCSDESTLFNTLTWTNPIETCAETDDVVGYRIYYAPLEDAEFTLIANIDDSRLLRFEHQPETGGIAGCYAVTAVDTFGNESQRSNMVCVDNCPFYELPNAFTPNGDGQNDLFVPTEYCFIESVEFQVFNRWGQLVFETNDPLLNWNGENLRGDELPSGTYFYRGKVFERRVAGITPAPGQLSGYIELIRE